MTQNVHKMICDGIQGGMDYTDYITLLNDFATNGKTTGEEQSDQRIVNTKLNAHRVKRLDKTVSIPDDKLRIFHNIPEKQVWLVLLESWCSDGAQTIPVLNKIAKAVPKIDLRIILRDEYPQLMDCFLTKGTRSIPKLLITDKEGCLLFVWGPRPKTADKMVVEYKSLNGKVDDNLKKKLQIWYNKDGGKTMVDELIEIINPL